MSERTNNDDQPRTLGVRGSKNSEEARIFAIDAARSLKDSKCEDVLVLDVRGLSQVTDFIVIGSGTSDRQMRSAIGDVVEIGEQRGFPALRSTEDSRAVWLLADFVDVIVHLFEPNTRAYYDLEMLWGDGERIAWERPGDADRNLAGLTPGEKRAGPA